MELLYGRAGRLTAKNGGFRPGQWFLKRAAGVKKGTDLPGKSFVGTVTPQLYDDLTVSSHHVMTSSSPLIM
jgi:hypothetical protein